MIEKVISKVISHNIHLRLGKVLYANKDSVTTEEVLVQYAFVWNIIDIEWKRRTTFCDYDQQVIEVHSVIGDEI